MAVRVKRLWNSLELATGTPGTAVFTATAYTMLTRVTICNNDVVARTVSAYIVRSGQAAALDDAEIIVKDKSIAPSETVSLEDLEGQVLNPTDALYLPASAATALTAHGSGIEVDP